MTNFSTNQVMQFYVSDTAKGQVLEKGPELPNGGFQFLIKDKDDAVIGSTDVIENVEYASYTSYANMAIASKKVTLTAAGTTLKAGLHVVRVSYPEIAGAGVEGWTTKVASYMAKKDEAAANLYAAIVADLKEAFEADGILEVKNNSGIVITVADRTKAYKRGIRPVVPVDFTVSTNEVEGENWASEPVISEGAAIPAVYKMMDMEYFAMGERGDQYRGAGWPDVIDTKYLVNESDEYDMIIAHFSYKGYNQNSHKSEKDLIVVGTATDLAGVKTALGIA